MIYTGLNRVGEIADVKAHGGADVAEVYGSINESNPIYYKTRTITGTSPLSYKALSKPLSDYLVSGNTVQNGTPTPSDPVDVVGCGVRTGNLWSNDNIWENTNTDTRAFFQPAIVLYNGSTMLGMERKDAKNDGRTYVVSIIPDSNYTRIYFKHNGESRDLPIGNIYGNFQANKPVTISFDVTAYNPTEIGGISISNIMLNSGSTALPYEPYGYKLPLTVNNTEYPIYLGQVETTRKIKKLVLTGEENWTITSNGVLRIGLSGQLRPSIPLCTHYLGSNSTAWANLPDKSVTVSIAGYLAILDTTYTTVADFKSYLAAQYAAGTPVTVWYVLAEPETAVVNEPLHKIGDYADTISFAQAGVTIPTVAGMNTLTVDTTVQPSEVSITGNIKEVSA